MTTRRLRARLWGWFRVADGAAGAGVSQWGRSACGRPRFVRAPAALTPKETHPSAIYEMIGAAAPAGTIAQAFSWLPPQARPARRFGAAAGLPRHNLPVVVTAIETFPVR